MKTSIKASGAQLEVASRLYVAGRNWEDGTEEHGEAYYLRITFPNGARYEHHEALGNLSRQRCPETGEQVFVFDPTAEERIQAFEARVRAADLVDLERWHEAEPAYGSEEYQRQGIEFERAMEERRDYL